MRVDNVVRGRKLVDSDWQHNKTVQGARRMVVIVGIDGRVDGMALQLFGEQSYDGISMAVIK